MTAIGEASRKLWPILWVLFLAEIVSSLEGSMLYAVLPTIARQYGLSSATWLITGYLLAAAAAAVLGGRLGDMYGRKRAMIAVLLVCTAGSLISALSSDLSWIVLGRILQGSSGAILPLGFGIARLVSPPSRTALNIGALSGAWAGAASLGYVLGGAFAEQGHWQYLFWLTAATPLFAAAGCAWVLPSDHREAPGGRMDWLGAGLIVPAMMLVQLGVGRIAHGGWRGLTLVELIGGAALLILWVVVELRIRSPLVDVRQLGHPKVAVANLANAFLGLGAMQLALVLMMLIQQPVATGVGFGVGATLAGILKLPSNLVSLATGPISGWIAGRRGARLPIIYGGAIMAVAWFGMIFARSELWHIIAGTFLGAIGSSLIMAGTPNLLVEVVDREDTSSAIGLTLVVRGVFTSVGAQVVGMMLENTQGASGHPSAHGYMEVMGYIGITSLGVLLMGLMLPGARRPAGRPGQSSDRATPSSGAAAGAELRSSR